MKSRQFFRRVAGVVMVFAIFGAGFVVGQAAPRKVASGGSLTLFNQSAGQPSAVDFNRFWEAWKVADTGFYGKNTPEKRVEGAISGMISSLGDPYTLYMPKAENELFQTDLTGSFSGIGAEISQINSLPTVVAPIPGSPAEKAGVKAKDIILKVDDKTTENEDFAAVINRIRGKIGTVVKLNIARDGAKAPIDINITRDTIQLPNVTAEVATKGSFKYGYLKLSEFMQDSDTKVATELDKFQAAGVKNVVLDLRNNPGGLLDVAVNIASTIIDPTTKPELKSAIVWQKDRNGKEQAFTTTRDPKYKDMAFVVLMNKGSASASEILSGALSDYGRAKLVGTVSFGKGSVQELKDLSDGASVKLTIAKWLTPAKKEIDKVGITPDVAVDEATATDSGAQGDKQRDKAVEILQATPAI